MESQQYCPWPHHYHFKIQFKLLFVVLSIKLYTNGHSHTHAYILMKIETGWHEWGTIKCYVIYVCARLHRRKSPAKTHSHRHKGKLSSIDSDFRCQPQSTGHWCESNALSFVLQAQLDLISNKFCIIYERSCTRDLASEMPYKKLLEITALGRAVLRAVRM